MSTAGTAVLVVAFVLSCIIGFGASAIGRRLSLLDWPDPAGGRKLHANVTPLVGGIAIGTAALVALGAVLVTTPILPLSTLAIALAAMLSLGVADDRFDISARLRLSVTIGVMVAALAFEPSFRLPMLYFADPPAQLALGMAGFFFALLCLVGLLNAVNMADGKNGIVISLAIIWMLVLLRHAPPELRLVLGATVVALATMLVFNMRGKLFLGDGGTYAIATLAGLVAIHLHNRMPAQFSAEMPAVMFAVPVLDTVRVMFGRWRRGQSPFEGDRDHLHHYLHSRLGWPRGLVVYVLLVGLPTLGSQVWPQFGLAWLLVTILAYMLVVLAIRPGSARLAQTNLSG